MEKIVELLTQRAKALDIFEIAEVLNAPVDAVSLSINALMREGKVALTKKGKYALPEDMGFIPAKTVILKNGTPAARPIAGGEDLIIRKRGAMRPMQSDTVLVRALPRDGGRDVCELVAITNRANETFMAVMTIPQDAPRGRGRRSEHRQAPFVKPIDARLTTKIELEGNLQGAKVGDMVLLRVTHWPEKGVSLRARVERVIGDAGDIRIRLRAIAAARGLPESFAPDALAQAQALKKTVDERDVAGRADMRSLTAFTIDGADAQDFDDAVSLEASGRDQVLTVHIADVSHYVVGKSSIDREALKRGTSTYLPGFTLPMLPEALCNDICSLKPDVDRLTMSISMTIRDGRVIDHRLTQSIIRSSARLTYEQVNRFFAGEESGIPEALTATLSEMNALAKRLREVRRARGSIDFDIPESVFELNAEGQPVDVFARSRADAERMIEDFMLLANETVAQIARHADLPFIYRVHAAPDTEKVRALFTFLGALGIKANIRGEVKPAQFQKILADVEGRREAGLIEQVMLRSLRRAAYSSVPEGHFGLATGDYCHFTSPIRRYPDLEVHRMLKCLLAGDLGAIRKAEKRMPELAKECSALEQRAALAERDADDLLKADYMAHHIGEVFRGIVTGVTAWGVYVTLENTVEGLVSIRTLDGEYVHMEERHQLMRADGETIRLGDAVRVRAQRVNLALSQIDFELTDQ